MRARHTKRKAHKKRPRGKAAAWALALLLLAASFLLFWAGQWAMEQLFPLPAEGPAPYRPQVGQPPYTIAVDAGHGGRDTGAVGLLEERQMTAATARALIQLLQADPNFIPVMARASFDTQATPAERAAYANAQGPDLLLSIHGNAAEDAGVAGFECYPITPGNAHHDESFYFARLLAQGMQQAGQSLRGQGGVRYLYFDQNGMRQIAESTDATVHNQPSFGILEGAACPAVLAEQCFITNEADVDLLADEDGCLRAAQIYYRAICDYFGVAPAA